MMEGILIAKATYDSPDGDIYMHLLREFMNDIESPIRTPKEDLCPFVTLDARQLAVAQALGITREAKSP